jgi:hypothetical protein
MTEQENAELIALLYPIATRFRGAMEHLKLHWEQIEDADDCPPMIGVFGTIQYFPWSCCDKTTLLLARHLHERGFTDVRSVYGDLATGEFGSHEWIEVGPILVDITADQFKNALPRPASIIATTDRSFHDRYNVQGELRYSTGWAAWKWSADSIAAAEWLYAKVKRLVEDE